MKCRIRVKVRVRVRFRVSIGLGLGSVISCNKSLNVSSYTKLLGTYANIL